MKVNGAGTIDVNLDGGFVMASATEWSFADGRGMTGGANAPQPGAVRGTVRVTQRTHSRMMSSLKPDVLPTTTWVDPPSTGDLRRWGAQLTTGWPDLFGSPNDLEKRPA